MGRGFFRTVRLLLGDLSGTVVFAVLLALGVSLFVATIAGIVTALTTVGVSLARRRPVGAMQWLSLALVIVSGGATLATSDPRYVMVKPSIIAAIVGLFMLRPGWLSRYVPADVERYVGDVTWLFGFIWAALMFLTAGLNLLIVMRYPNYWLAFLAIFPALSKLTLFVVHFSTATFLAARRKHRDSVVPQVLSSPVAN
ncbi:MAG: septation protein IspZ [Tsuneonella sp.]